MCTYCVSRRNINALILLHCSFQYFGLMVISPSKPKRHWQQNRTPLSRIACLRTQNVFDTTHDSLLWTAFTLPHLTHMRLVYLSTI